MSVQTLMLHVRVEDSIKTQAAQAFPLELKVPNARTRAAMEESRAMMARTPRFNSAQEMFDELEKASQ